MKVEQAIFTSARTSRMQGYHLVARSAGINNVLSQELFRWGPSQASLIGNNVSDWSLNFFPAAGQRLAISRTLYGGPEYSGRGGLQIVTMILVLERDQLYGYDYNPLLLAHTALMLGHLRLPKNFEDPIWPIEFPEQAPYASEYRLTPADQTDEDSAEVQAAVTRLLRQQRRVAIVGATNPLAIIDRLIHRTALLQRTELSFTTGLKPSLQRRFQLHFLPQVDMKLENELAAQGISQVTVPSAN